MASGHSSTQKEWSTLRRVILILGFLLLSHAHAAAADEVTPPVRLKHQPIETHRLPTAGTLMPVSVQLENSSDVDIKIRLVGSRDGRFMDIAFPMGVLNETDRPTYTIQLPAPVAAMT